MVYRFRRAMNDPAIFRKDRQRPSSSALMLFKKLVRICR
jgi:hypothetical protein